MAADLKTIAEKLAGSGNLTEIIQKMELILELQRETIEKTSEQVEDSGDE